MQVEVAMAPSAFVTGLQSKNQQSYQLKLFVSFESREWMYRSNCSICLKGTKPSWRARWLCFPRNNLR
ncbi:Uncharacterized protein APZ42_012782 [Daphnia magna]|uniref:Uncharacterized protein n=1 Tax=Daphnia magna TaxID=35525 RepID=A0A162RHD7_9CRUS|nr:Uncharacterized protein APZ42_012782 [Daphnia magna]